MPKQLTDPSPRTAALVAGVGYAALFVLAVFANFFVRTGLVDPDDPAATFTNIADSEMLFRSGLVAFLLVFVIDVVVAWALYLLFKAVNRELSLLTAWLRLVYTAFLGVAVIFLWVVVELVSGADYLVSFEQGQLDAHVTLALEAFNYAWLIGLACFGLHLLMLAFLIVASGMAPQALGYVLGIAGAAYVLDTLANALVVDYADHADVFLAAVAVPSVVAELWLTLWLLLRGGRQQATDHRPAQVLQDA
jgi:hypothetical protein